MVTDRTAVLIVRAWAEPDAPSSLRASARYTSAVGVGAWHTIKFADPDAIAEFVRAWLAEVEAGASSREEPETTAEDNWLNDGGANAG
ncbi:MAG: hypothetical protein GEU80_17315 [Dehalococcoidia bacterium]|nr:hypothetical protein [Dehalococcoidia bacterium]